MSKARNLSDLLDANGDVVSGSLDNVPPADLVNDTTPQLGGTLDANGNTIDMGVNVITDTAVGNWDTAYSWGDHSTQNYATTTGDTMTGALNFGDNVKAQFGASNDLQIYHNGSYSLIDDQGTGPLVIQGTNLFLKSSTGEQYVICNADGSVNLYHDNVTRLTTTSSGVSVTGTVSATSFSGDGSSLTGLSAGNVDYLGHKMCIMSTNNQANFSINASAYSALVILIETNDAGNFRVNSTASDFNVATAHTSGTFNLSLTNGTSAYSSDWGTWAPPASQGTEAASSFILSKASPTSSEGFTFIAWQNQLRAKLTFWGVY